LAVAIAIFVVAVAASLLKRCHAPLDAGVVPDAKRPSTLIGQPEQVGTRSQSNLPTAAGAISGTSEAKPAVKGRTIQVSDIFGAKVRGARIRNTRIDGSSGRDLITSEDGRAEVPEDAWEDSFPIAGT